VDRATNGGRNIYLKHHKRLMGDRFRSSPLEGFALLRLRYEKELANSALVVFVDPRFQEKEAASHSGISDDRQQSFQQDICTNDASGNATVCSHEATMS
jgi:hypothetical protein